MILLLISLISTLNFLGLQIRRSPPKILKIRFIKSSYESISAQIRRTQYDVVEELRKFTEHAAEPQD
jgi:hypothetical protein